MSQQSRPSTQIFGRHALDAASGIVNCTFTNKEQKRDPIVCTADKYYTVRNDGKLHEGTVGSATTTAIPGQWTQPTGSGTGATTGAVYNWSVNGLGIVQGGNVAYAFGRYTRGSDANQSSNPNQFVQVLKYDVSTGAFTHVGSQLQVNTTANGNAYFGRMVAGAVDPISGNYYFGGYGANSENDSRFRLYKFDVSTNTTSYVGWIQPDDVGVNDAGNGDIGFDHNGNLFLIYSTSAGVNKIVPVTQATLAAAGGGGEIKALLTQPTIQAQEALQYNGIAFLADGKIVVQAGDTANPVLTKVWTADPNTWALSNEASIFTAAPLGTDLASCTYPPTIKVKKNIVARVQPGDQFTMQVKRDGLDEVLAEATTTTRATPPTTGVQDEVAGPAIARSGEAYTITETGANGANLANYATTWTCTAAELDDWSLSGTGATINIASFPYPPTGTALGPNVECTFTNSPKVGLTLVKTLNNPTVGTGYSVVDDWTLTATGSGSAAGTTVAGVTGAPAVTSAIVPAGSYALTESFTGTPNVSAGYQWTSLVCRDGANNVVSTSTVVDGVVTAASATLANNTSVTCTYTNTPKLGIVTWTKVDGADDALLAGSEWTVDGPGFVAPNNVVADCVEANAAACTGFDKDPVAGQFRLEGLYWGSFTVTETKVPDGYVGREPFTFTVDHTKVSAAQDLGKKANTRALGSVAWAKVDNSSPAQYLARSEWKIVGPSPATTELAVVDCVAADAAGCAGQDDKNHLAGQLRVEGLAWGSYQLIETRAPAGYKLNATPHEFTIAGTALVTVTGSPFVNVPREGPVLPLTGGLGRDAFFIAGLLIAALGFGAVGVQARNRRKGVA